MYIISFHHWVCITLIVLFIIISFNFVFFLPLTGRLNDSNNLFLRTEIRNQNKNGLGLGFIIWGPGFFWVRFLRGPCQNEGWFNFTLPVIFHWTVQKGNKSLWKVPWDETSIKSSRPLLGLDWFFWHKSLGSYALTL